MTVPPKTSVRSIVVLFLVAGSMILAAPPPPPPRSLDSLFQSETLWDATADQFIALYQNLGFRWNSVARNIAQASGPGLLLFQNPIAQSLARFETGKLKEIDFLFYDRGDNGDLSKEDFELLVGNCENALNRFTGTPVTQRGKDAANAVKAQSEEWQTPRAHFILKYSSTRELKARGVPFRAEFVRLEVTPVAPRKGLLEQALPPRADQLFSGPAHVRKNPSGDVAIDGIPMVDQGRKGYCVDASVERVLRYYGQKVDQNELAQAANTSAIGGTDCRVMFEALKKLTARLHIRTRTIEPFDIKKFIASINEYNRLTHKGRRAEEVNIYEPDSDLGSIYHQMKFDLFREARMKNPAEADRFEKAVEAHVDAGIPLLWSVVVGLAPENPPIHGFGGHMRLIIGYNHPKQEILYSDSWGPGHELKRMPLADAWTITNGVNTVEPLGP